MYQVQKSLCGLSKVHIVRGNEACDLDSAVCAVVYAFYLHQTQSESSIPVVPLLNLVEADYVLHTEVTYALQDCGITQELLIFRDQVNLTDLHESHRLVLTLVDHNAMSPEERSLEGAVCEVVDHHTRVKEFPPSVDVTLELVGSCCSLVAEKLLNDARFDVDPLVAHLLLGTILLDTVCLVDGKKKDVCQAERLEILLPGESRQETYEALLGARRQISAPNIPDVLWFQCYLHLMFSAKT
ncbi:hypothetical protein NP493_1060g00009 [Ridgeia piscesae]|uniref:DDH domain-containing protein n=1 Tax=Ridgeia piscesae TaxID=27915 RepID=A0AAD9NK33_RIDPI|nr:hypothetical protein NP493_1060g00009 [Ridgeia piscesae]